MCGTIFRYLGNHFVINFNKIADRHYVWISVIGDAELAKDFFVKVTLGKGQAIKISQCGRVFPITMRWEDIFKAWLPDGYSQRFKSVFGPSGFWTMAPLRYAAKFDPFLSFQILPSGNLGMQTGHV